MTAQPLSAEQRGWFGELADRIEAEMRRIGYWQEELPAEKEVLEGGAFGHQAVAFPTWIQRVLLTRLRQVAAGELEPPEVSMVGTQAIREFDGDDRAYDLASLMSDVDGLIRRLHDDAPE